MGSKLRKEDIINKINELGIELDSNIKWTNDKMIKKLGYYYLPEEDKNSFCRNFMQSMETVQLCHHLKDEIQFFDVSPLERDDFIAEFKENGSRCLHGTARILCEDGIERTIQDIVENKIETKVLSYNESTKQVEYKPIIGWFNNGKKTRSNWVTLKGVNTFDKLLKITKDHKVFTNNRGYVEAQYITPEDEVCIRYKGCNDTQLQVLLGSYLGDGGIKEEKRSVRIPRYRLQLAHSVKQKDYLELKINVFNDFARKMEKYKSGYGSECYRTHLRPMYDINKYIKNKLSDESRVSSELLDNIDWLGLAIWYLDDGSLCKSHEMDESVTNKECRASIAVCRYNIDEGNLIKNMLATKFGVQCTLHKIRKDDDMYVLVTNTATAPVFFQNIAKYVPTCMEHKLPPHLRGGEKIEWWNDTKHAYSSLVVKGLTVKEHFHLDPAIEKPGAGMICYDIEVADNHNFYANGILVHNCVTCYDPNEGFRFFSRNETVTDFLNNEFTEKLVFINNGIITKGSDYKGKFPCRFALDGELLVNDDTMTFEGRHYENMEDFLQGILSSLPQRAIDYQINGHPIKLICYDIMYFEPNPGEAPIYTYDFKNSDRQISREEFDWVTTNFQAYFDDCNIKPKFGGKKPNLLVNYLASLKDTPKYDMRKYPFYKRRQARRKVLEVLAKAKLPFSEVDGEDNFKIDYLDNVLRSGGEGIVIKCLDAPYISALKSSRSHKACMKVKQTVSEMMKNDGRHMDFDVFISGCNPPKSDRIKDMIGALKCSIYLENEFGEIVEHEIANISGISHELKKKLTLVDENGKISLNPEYLGKVIAIDGMALSHTSLRFQHAVLKDKEDLVFKDKAPKDCEWTREALEKMVIVRGFE